MIILLVKPSDEINEYAKLVNPLEFQYHEIHHEIHNCLQLSLFYLTPQMMQFI